MRVISRSALKRLLVLLAVLAALLFYCWWTMIRMPLKSYSGELAALTEEQQVLRDELKAHVEKLAGTIGERNIFQPAALKSAVRYIESTFTNAGLTVSLQTFEANGETCHNIEVEIPGSVHPEEIVIIGAHYDSVLGAPGADDNATGTAAALALAKSPALQHPARTLRFVAFMNEEPPFFETEYMGSLVYAKRCRERNEKIVAMLSIESIGCYNSKSGSQKYPFPMGLFYPSRGDFFAIVGRSSDAVLVRRCIKTFRENAQFPSEGGALPGALPGVGWSDHWAFWQVGYPAIMLSDTATFRSPDYHLESDTVEKLDYGRMARVVDGLTPVIVDLCNH